MNMTTGKVKIGTFYYYCKQANIQIYSEKTKHIINRVKISKAQGNPTIESVSKNLLVANEIIVNEEDEQLIKELIESKVGQLRNLSGYKKHYEQYGDTVAQDFFEKGTSVQQLRQLKQTIGKDDFNDIASGHIDDILKKHLTFDAVEPSVNMAALKKELGLHNSNSLQYGNGCFRRKRS